MKIFSIFIFASQFYFSQDKGKIAYDNDEFQDNIDSLGYGINVFQESINKTFREYLVNYDYLTRLLENYGFILLTDEASPVTRTSSPFKTSTVISTENGVGVSLDTSTSCVS